MRTVLLVVAGLALLAYLAVAVVMPQMAGAELKDAAQALLAGAKELQTPVDAAAQKAGTLAGSGKGVKSAARTDARHGALKWVVSDNGAVRGWNEKNAIEIALTPELRAGKVEWSCRGYPNGAMPASCGGR